MDKRTAKARRESIVYCSSCNKTRLRPGHRTRISVKNGGVICSRCFQIEKEERRGIR